MAGDALLLVNARGMPFAESLAPSTSYKILLGGFESRRPLAALGPVAKVVPDGPPTSSPSVRSLPVRVVVGARRASPSARRERARIPPSPPISSFVPFHQQVERLSVGKRKSSAVKTCSSIARFPANAAVRLDLAICREFRPFSRVLKSFPPWR